MKYKILIHKPGIDFYDKKGEPHAFPPDVQEFEATSHTEGLNIAWRIYNATGLKEKGHFDVGPVR